ncbi:hypothetical protein, partial [Enterococcus faecium]
MSGLNRRGFVKLGTGMFFLGLPIARADQIIVGKGAAIPAPAPANWAEFRAEMKKRNQPGVLVL